jgi:LuxR family maltose regulon positive regulatory protein
MSAPILATKLFVPALPPQVADRPRLTARLNEGMTRKLTLISAPAGFGKTTALVAGIQGQRVAWLSLDEHDNDPTLFLSYLVAGLQQVDSHLGETARTLLQEPNPPAPPLILASLINELAQQPQRILLVLEDYHTIHHPEIHQSLTYLIERQPPQLHLVITGRADPPLPLARLRVRQEMNEIRAADLRFTTQEAAAFLQDLWGLNLSPADVAALEARTEGWIAGLQLAALSMQSLQNETAQADFVANFTGSHRYVLDYLIDEALEKQPPHVQEFLLRTSILDRLCDPLCQAVLDGTRPTITLEDLESANLFLTPLDEQREWYRYHRLFADLLRHRLKQSYPDQLPLLHRRASRWCEQNDLTGEAIRHALAGEEPERAGDLVEQARSHLRNRGEIVTLRSWLDMLPQEMVDASGPLAMARAWTLMYAGKMAETEAYFERVLPALLTQSTGNEPWRAELAMHRGQIALNHGHFEQALTFCLEARARIPAEQGNLRAGLGILLGHAYRVQGKLAEAHASYTEAEGIAIESDNRFLRISAITALGNLAILRGRLSEALSLWQQSLPLSQNRRQQPLPVASLAHVGIGRIYYERNQLEQAEAHLSKAVKLAQQSGLGPMVLNGGYSLNRVRQAQGDYAQARLDLQTAESMMQRTQMRLLDLRLDSAHAELDLAMGNIDQAVAWADGLLAEYGLDKAAKPGDWFHMEYIALVRVRLAQGRPEDAADVLARMIPAAEVSGNVGTLIELLALHACTLHALGESDQAVEVLIRGLTLAKPEGFVRSFVNAGQELGELLARVAVMGVPVSGYARDLLTAFDAPPHPGQAPPPAPDAPHADAGISPDLAQWLAEPLSEREAEVLALVAEGLSNREIGERLVISTSTVKKHMENIHSKLYVRNRTQAVARARELGLLA